MSYRPVDEAFWTDPKVRGLSMSEKLLFLYFITNPHASFTGLYYLPLPTLLFETGYTEKDFRKGIYTLSNGYQVLHDEPNSLFWVVKMAKFQVSSDKQIAGVRRHIQTLHKSFLIAKFAERYPTFIDPSEYPIDTLSDGYRYPTDTTDRERETKTDRETKPRQEKTDFPPTLDTPEFRAIWTDWEESRRQIKKPITSQARKKQLESLAEYGVDTAIQTIKASIMGQWQGLFPERYGKKTTATGTPKDYVLRSEPC